MTMHVRTAVPHPSTTESESKYVPAAGHDWLLPLYDPCIRLLLPEREIRGELIESTRVGPQDRVLDLGCGTGTLAVMLKETQPQAAVVGLDGDPRALAIARRKAEKAGVDIRLDEALCSALPYEDGSFDRVVSSFVFHHLGAQVKRQALAEVHRVLRPGGLFVLQDFGPQVSRMERAVGRVFRGAPEIQENLQGALPRLMGEAGFSEVEEIGQRSIRIARIWTYRASR